MIISCKSYSSSDLEKPQCLLHDESETVLNVLTEYYIKILVGLSSQTLSSINLSPSSEVAKKILLLWQLHAHLVQFSGLLDRILDIYLTPRGTLLDSRRFALRPNLLNE